MPHLLCGRRLGCHHQQALSQMFPQPCVQAEVRLLDFLDVRDQGGERCSIHSDEVGTCDLCRIELDWAVPEPCNLLIGGDGDLLEDLNVCQRSTVILWKNRAINRQSLPIIIRTCVPSVLSPVCIPCACVSSPVRVCHPLRACVSNSIIILCACASPPWQPFCSQSLFSAWAAACPFERGLMSAVLSSASLSHLLFFRLLHFAAASASLYTRVCFTSAAASASP